MLGPGGVGRTATSPVLFSEISGPGRGPGREEVDMCSCESCSHASWGRNGGETVMEGMKFSKRRKQPFYELKRKHRLRDYCDFYPLTFLN